MSFVRKAGFLIIGNEILSGGTVEKNLSVLSELLNGRGWRLFEARIVRDEQNEIVAAIAGLRRAVDYIFTSGGIGPTHDDITTVAVAAACRLTVVENADIVARLQKADDARGATLTAARRRMARTPAGAVVLDSEYGGPPGYRINDIFVCAGVPSIFYQMAAAAVCQLPPGAPARCRTVRVMCGESAFADSLAAIQAAHSAVEIGSYPSDAHFPLQCRVRFVAADDTLARAAAADFMDYLRRQEVAYCDED